MLTNRSRPPCTAVSSRKSTDGTLDFNKCLTKSGSWCSDTSRPTTPSSARSKMGTDSARATPTPGARPRSVCDSARKGDNGGGGVKVTMFTFFFLRFVKFPHRTNLSTVNTTAFFRT